MNIEDKLRLARQLEGLQVDVVEAGFPIASDGDFEAVKRISAEVRETSIAGLARAGNRRHPEMLGGTGEGRPAQDPHLSSDKRYPSEAQVAEVERRSAGYGSSGRRTGVFTV